MLVPCILPLDTVSRTTNAGTRSPRAYAQYLLIELEYNGCGDAEGDLKVGAQRL
jgi:hypothetical protein